MVTTCHDGLPWVNHLPDLWGWCDIEQLPNSIIQLLFAFNNNSLFLCSLQIITIRLKMRLDFISLGFPLLGERIICIEMVFLGERGEQQSLVCHASSAGPDPLCQVSW